MLCCELILYVLLDCACMFVRSWFVSNLNKKLYHLEKHQPLTTGKNTFPAFFLWIYLCSEGAVKFFSNVIFLVFYKTQDQNCIIFKNSIT